MGPILLRPLGHDQLANRLDLVEVEQTAADVRQPGGIRIRFGKEGPDHGGSRRVDPDIVPVSLLEIGFLNDDTFVEPVPGEQLRNGLDGLHMGFDRQLQPDRIPGGPGLVGHPLISEVSPMFSLRT